MNATRLGVAAFLSLCVPALVCAGPAGGSVTGKVTLSGSAPKPKPIDLSKEPACVKMHASDPLLPETAVTGAGNTLRNVVIYISAGDAENAPVPANSVSFDQQGCHYTTHVAAFRVGQELKISNNDPISHNIHPMAKVNREWNRIQLPGVPPFSYSFEREEIIPVKCNIHPWMQGYFVVLRTSHFAVTGEDGRFSLPNLPPGHYVITAWHETYGAQSKEITIGGGESQSLDFSFTAKP
jgi:Carboxypeptidase regulatory-like domain